MSRRARRVGGARQDTRASGPTFQGSVEHRLLIGLIGLKIVALIVVFDAQSDQAFDFAKSIASHASAWMIMAVLVVSVMRYGVGILPHGRLALAAAVFVLANAVSGLFAESPYLALYGERFRFLGLTFLLDMSVLFVAVSVAMREARDWLVPGALFALALLGSFAYAIVQRLGLDPIIWVDDARARPFSTFGNPDQYGLLLGIAFAVALGIAVLGASFPRSLRWAAAALAAGTLGVSAIVATRATLLGALVALVAVVTLLVVRAGRT